MHDTFYARVFTIILLAGLAQLGLAEQSQPYLEAEMKAEVQFATTVIYVKKDAKSVLDFYHRAFDLPIKYYEENLDFGELDAGSVSIMIASYQAGTLMVAENFQPAKDDKPANVELAFITDNVDAAYEKAIAAGAKPAREPVAHPWGQTAAYVFSIEGTLIGILTPPTNN